ncbi:MAG: hypothetical protein LBT97_00680 [Planctomycetota bacterium]|jgi:hypothetical protein|nr:hypothetical protein [Planctomycetota bacterium]
MTTLVEEPIRAEEEVQVGFGFSPPGAGARQLNRDVVGIVNREAAAVETEALAAFLELLHGADPDYIDAPTPQAPEAPVMNWDEVGSVLAESQDMLLTMQDFLAAVLSGYGIENPENVRIFEDVSGVFRLIGEYENREMLEAALNNPENRQLHELYRAVSAGMSLAGSLIGGGSLPEEVRKRAYAGSPAA